MKEAITAQFIREHFSYDPATGALDRKDKGAKRRAHTGTMNHRKDTSYVVLTINRRKVYGHRAAWMYVNGDIPDGMVIDHIDNDGTNNRIGNLRAVTKSLNQRNRRPAASRFLPGVHAHRGGFVVYFASKYAGWARDFFEACCLRKSLEAANGYIIKGAAS